MVFGYAPQGSSGMSYCNQTPFPPTSNTEGKHELCHSGLDYGLNFGLDFGLESFMYELTWASVITGLDYWTLVSMH